MQLLNKTVRHRRIKTQQILTQPLPKEFIEEVMRQTSACIDRLDTKKLRKGKPLRTLPNIFDLEASIRDEARFKRKLGLVMHMRSTHSKFASPSIEKSQQESWQHRCGALAQSSRTAHYKEELPAVSSIHRLQMKRREKYRQHLQRLEELARERRSLARSRRFQTVLEYLP